MKYLVTLGAAAAVVVATGLTPVLAGGHDPVEKREAIMKTLGQSAKTVGDMLKGETEFDAAKANAALAAMHESFSTFGELYPEGSETPETKKGPEPAPAVWSDREGFDAEIAKFNSAVDAALAASPDSKEALGAVFGPIGKSCGSCHEDYRIKRE